MVAAVNRRPGCGARTGCAPWGLSGSLKRGCRSGLQTGPSEIGRSGRGFSLVSRSRPRPARLEHTGGIAMSWELDLQYAKGRLSAELQAAAGGRRLDLVLIQSEGHDEFERLLNDALPDFRPNIPRPSDAILSRSRLVTLPPALSEDCRVWGRTILCKALLPRSVTEWDDAAELDRRNRLAESLQECFAELGSCLALAPPPLQSLIEKSGVATLDPFERWLSWLFDRALRPNAKPPLSAARDYGTVSAADAATSLRQAPDSGWFAVLPDALRASQFLVDVITTKTPPAAEDAAKDESMSEQELRPKFYPQEVAILNALDGKVLKLESLADALRVSKNKLYLKPWRDDPDQTLLGYLMNRGLVVNDTTLGGYYRPDRPPRIEPDNPPPG